MNTTQSKTSHVTGRKGGGKGGGGGGGGGKEFREDPNNLRSKSTARLVGMISAGPVKGLVNGAHSILFGNTPLQNADGTYNFQGVSWQVRHGYPDQDVLPGFTAVEREIAVAQRLKYGNPIVRVIDDPNVDAVRIKLGLDALSYTNQNEAHLTGTSVSFAVDISEAGGPFVNALSWTISGKTTSPYEQGKRITLARGRHPWKIQVRRLTEESSSSLLQNSSSWTSYTEIIDSKLSYADTAVLGLTLDAQLFGDNLQKMAVDINGRLVLIPSNYNPYTREYSGFWDGTFKRDWTDNPAWIFYDMLTDPDIGLGQYVYPEYVDTWSLYEIGKYCDEPVDDGFGGKEPRFTYNCAVFEQKQAYEALTLLAGVFRGMMYWGPGTVMLTQDAPTQPSFDVTPANLITEGPEDPPINYEGTAFSARHSVALVTWANPEEGYAATIESYEDPDLVREIGWRPVDVVETGCISQGQAARKARYIIDTEKNATQTVSFRRALDGAFDGPGSVCRLSDPAYAGARTGGRLVATSPVELRMDAPFEFLASEQYRLWLTMPDGIPQEIPIHNPGVETDTVHPLMPLADPPPSGSIFAVLATNLEPQQYRILGVEETDKNVYSYIGLQHDPTKYPRIEQGLQLDKPGHTLLPVGPLFPPTDLTVREVFYLAGGVAPKSMAVFSWKPTDDPRVLRYDVQAMRPGTDTWFSLGHVTGVSVDIQDTEPGHWKFGVRAFDGLGRYSQWAYLEADLLALYVPPPDVRSFRLESIGSNALLTWSKVDVLYLSHYQIRYSPVRDGVAWEGAGILAESVPGTSTSLMVQARNGTYLIKAFTVLGIESENATAVYSDVVTLDGLNVVDVLVEDPDFSGRHVRTAFDPEYQGLVLGTNPETDLFDLEDFFDAEDFFLDELGLAARGEYYFSNNPLDLGAVFSSRIGAHMVASIRHLRSDFFDREDFFDWNDFFGPDLNGCVAWIEIRTTKSNPGRNAYGTEAEWEEIWSPWEPLHYGEVSARGFEFRCVLETTDTWVTPLVTELSVEVDMPDRIISGDDISIGAVEGGVWVPFTPPFMKAPSLAVTVQDMVVYENGTSDRYHIVEKTESGFRVAVFDNLGHPVERTIDFMAKSYGYRQ